MSWATRDIHWLEQRAATPKGEANPLKPIWFGSRAATRSREAEIPSNRMLSTYGEYVPGPCTHCLSSQPSRVMVRICFRADSNHSSVRRIKSTQGICRGTCRWITSYETRKTGGRGDFGRPVFQPKISNSQPPSASILGFNEISLDCTNPVHYSHHGEGIYQTYLVEVLCELYSLQQ